MLVFEKDRAGLIRDSNEVIDSSQRLRFATLLKRRSAGEPIAYICGRREFWSLDIEVNPAVLIPRPDTELLVERALNIIDSIDHPEPALADLGTGSGAIALAIASERPHVRVVATDRSTEAVQLASNNARRLRINNVEFRTGNWTAALRPHRFQIIVSNPPYIRKNDPHLSQDDVRHEPLQALVSGHSGLNDLCEIIRTAASALLPSGWLLVEHGYDQGPAVRALFEQNGYREIRTQRDLSNIERVTEGQTGH